MKKKSYELHQVILSALLTLAAAASCAASPTVTYVVNLTDAETHLVGVTLTVPAARAGTVLQFPAWNALYQIRDFVRNVQDLQAECGGRPGALQPVDVDTFRTTAPCSPLRVTYQVFAHKPGVFSSSLIPGHAFLNLADILFYLPDARTQPDVVRFVLPVGWKLITPLEGDGAAGSFTAPNYDALVDSPVEAGDFALYTFTQGGALYRIAVRGDAGGVSAARLVDTVKAITATETSLMEDRPFERYTFIFHFPTSGGGGGMEHSYGSAISFPEVMLATNWGELENVIAHEFFHLWNVKRIRPRGLVPVDYVHGNDTRDLWFCEGVTSTYAELVLLRSGLISRSEFYSHVSRAIDQLQSRPARHFQSVELAGIDAWLEGYPDYFRPERSISYYNKGELLGYLLDLEIRHSSRDAHSLDDVMRLLNTDFAKRGKTFDDRDLESIISSLGPSPAWVHNFFAHDVDGAQELDYPRYLGYGGLKLDQVTVRKPDWGFRASRGFGSEIRVISLEPGGPAVMAGVRLGDVLQSVNGQRLYALPSEVTGLKPGQRVKLGVVRDGKAITLKFRLGSQSVTDYRIEEAPDATPAQIAWRDRWLGRVSPPSDPALVP